MTAARHRQIRKRKSSPWLPVAAPKRLLGQPVGYLEIGLALAKPTSPPWLSSCFASRPPDLVPYCDIASMRASIRLSTTLLVDASDHAHPPSSSRPDSHHTDLNT